jgi:hypothetical protein
MFAIFNEHEKAACALSCVPLRQFKEARGSLIEERYGRPRGMAERFFDMVKNIS